MYLLNPTEVNKTANCEWFCKSSFLKRGCIILLYNSWPKFWNIDLVILQWIKIGSFTQGQQGTVNIE